MRRITLTIDDVVDDRAKTYCKENNISKSALYSTAVTSYLSAMEQLPRMKADLQLQIDELREAVSKMSVKP